MGTDTDVRKADAMELARLLYEIFVETQNGSDNMINGQNNANQPSDD